MVFRMTATASSLRYTRPQPCGKIPVQINDLGEWWNLLLRETAVSMRRLGG